MENLDISRVLTTLADLLEIQGANPFRIRAYRNAVNTINSHSRPLAAMVEAGEDLTDLPDVGKSVATHIEEFVRTGTITRLQEVSAEFPVTLVELMRLDGVGPKKARKLFEELDVKTVDDLAARIDEGAVQSLDGFGVKSAEKIRRSIENHRQRTGRFQIHEVEKLIAGALEHVRGTEGVGRVEVAGSLRRRKETIGDVDLLAEYEGDGTVVVDRFVAFDGAERVLGAGPTKGSIVLHSGLQVDLRVIPPRSFGAALQYFTGSKEHNVAVRTRAVRMGLRVNEWGVFRLPEDEAPGEDQGPGEGSEGAGAAAGRDTPAAAVPLGEQIAGVDEQGVYAVLGMALAPPEIRENRGEVEAAIADDLPPLVTLADIRGDLQMHSTWSDGKTSIEEMAIACRDLGYEYLAVTDHSQAMAMVQGLTPERARDQWVEVDEVRARVEGIDLLRSAEIDILKDGSLDLPDDILAELDVVVVSVHSFMDLEKKAMTERVLKAMMNPAVDILAHPTGRRINKREPYALDVETVLEAAAELSIAVELNANPNRLDLNDVHVHRAKELGVPVVISTDAHSPRGLGDMRFGVDQARRGWLGPSDVLNTKSAKELRAWLGRRDP